MKKTIFKVEDQEFTITEEMILSAMKEYDAHHRLDKNDSGRRYAVEYEGKLYPPKILLSLITKKPRGSFYGGKGKSAANAVFVNLGFEIVQVNEGEGIISRSKKVKYDQTKISAPIPQVQDLIQSLFSSEWVNLHDSRGDFEDGIYPGVYVLAYSKKALAGQPVKEEDIFYVGMTNASINQRLNQFIRGLEDGSLHSGASRFFKEYAGEVPYSRLRNRKTFFVAFASIPRIVDKEKRTPQDLRKMGEVVRLELYVLAHIKEKLQIEPELNKK
jgi:hypothetical protein